MKKYIIFMITTLFIVGCSNSNTYKSREEVIPIDSIKVTQDSDVYPPIMHSSEWEEPIPISSKINTAGVEDSAFITPNGDVLYFWFTPDSSATPQEQLIDGATGIYFSKKINGEWQEAERIILQDNNKNALDGCEFVYDDVMWFCSARDNYDGINWFIAKKDDDKWGNWEQYQFSSDWEVGELHITKDNNELYYHSSNLGKGGLDIWKLSNINGEWKNPENIEILNSTTDEGWPFITENMDEIWITRTYMGTPALFRSKRVDGKWQEPELIISQFAGEASLDNDGNIYFTHHYYKENNMIESDIYVAYKKIN